MYVSNATTCHSPLLKALLDPTLYEKSSASTLRPAAQLKKLESSYLVMVDLPGVTKDNIRLETHCGVLSLKADRENFNDETIHYELKMQLPEDALQEQTKAQMSNGVLSLEIPKHAPQPITLSIL